MTTTHRRLCGAVAVVLVLAGCNTDGPSVETAGSTGTSLATTTASTVATTTSTTAPPIPVGVDAEALQPWVDGICAAVGPWGVRATAMGPDDLEGWSGPAGPPQARAARQYGSAVSATADAIDDVPAVADDELSVLAEEATATLRRSATEWEAIAGEFDAMADDHPERPGWDELMERHHRAEEAATAAFGELMSYPVRAGADTGGCGVLLSVIDGSLQPWIDEVCAAAEPLLYSAVEVRGPSAWAVFVREQVAIMSATADAIEGGIEVAGGEFRTEAESAVVALRRSATEWEAMARELDEMGEDLTGEESERLGYLVEYELAGPVEAVEALGRFLVFPAMASSRFDHIDRVGNCGYSVLFIPTCGEDAGPPCTEGYREV